VEREHLHYNGSSPNKMYCYCEATKRKLCEWLARRYETPEALGRVWNRYSYSDWDDVEHSRISAAIPKAWTGSSSASTTLSSCFTGARRCFAGSIPSALSAPTV